MGVLEERMSANEDRVASLCGIVDLHIRNTSNASVPAAGVENKNE